MTPLYSTVPTGTTGATSPDSSTSVPVRWADCGSAELPGWQVGWAQIIGARHARYSEDHVAHVSLPINPTGGTGRDTGNGQSLCLAVADGVGGGSHAEVASAALAEHCTSTPPELYPNPQALTAWMALAEGQVQLKLRERSPAPGAATLAAAWLLPPVAGHSNAVAAQGYLLRVGDARLYRFDGQAAHALTTDQTYAATGEDPGSATPDDPARMVGTCHMGTPEIVPLNLPAGHTLLLCSDGLHRGLAPQDIAAILLAQPNLEVAAHQLAEAARQQGSQDDISVLLARVQARSSTAPCPPQEDLRAKLHRWLTKPL